ncbi:hypothetical protein KCU73_g2258, partial [Aureobasidium melanogenum]
MVKLEDRAQLFIRGAPTTDISAPEAKHESKARQIVSDNRLYEYAEHAYLGDKIALPGIETKQLALGSSRISLTYGQINGLAGDFFGTMQPICQGDTEDEREKRFIAAYNTLVNSGDTPTNLLDTLQAEIHSLREAKKAVDTNKEEFSKLYHPTDATWLAARSLFLSGDQPAFLNLASVNFDHFGDDAGTAYNTGHRVALKHAREASFAVNPTMSDSDRKHRLMEAYTMNAFADHFLEDRFSAGHLRTPRRKLAEGPPIIGNYCAKRMHDEDNKAGLWVMSPDRPDKWRVYGDGNLLKIENNVTVDQCLKALNASVNEVYMAWLHGTCPSEDSNFAAWAHAPTLSTVSNPELDNAAPLFNRDGYMRDPTQLDHHLREDQVRYAPYYRKEATAKSDEGDSYLFPTATAHAGASAYVMPADYNGKHQFLNADASATAGSYLGVDANVSAYSLENDNAKLKLGLGIDTGLGMGGNPLVIDAMKNTLDVYGANSGGSRNLAGHSPLVEDLEARIASLHKKPAAL